MTGTPPIREDWLERMRSRPELLRALFDNFQAEEPARLAAMHAAVAAGDHAQARYLAHSLKGSAAILGMERLSNACRELEFASRDQDRPRMEAAMACVGAELAKVFAAMDGLRASEPALGGVS